MTLIAMTGRKRSGKDTVAGMIAEGVEYVAERFHDAQPTDTHYERIAFAGPLKTMIKSLLMSSGMNPAEAEERVNGSEAMKEEPLAILQGKSTRYAMQTLGTEWRDYLGKDLWTFLVQTKIDHIEQSGTTPIITDMRFLHEDAFVRERGGVTVRVKRAGQGAGADPHPSEVEMEKIEPMLTIYNYGNLEQLEVAASTVACLANSGFSLSELILAKDL